MVFTAHQGTVFSSLKNFTSTQIIMSNCQLLFWVVLPLIRGSIFIFPPTLLRGVVSLGTQLKSLCGVGYSSELWFSSACISTGITGW